MRRYAVLLALLLLGLWATAQAQPRPQVFQLHSAEAGNVAGTVISTFGYPSVTADNSIAAAWDGTANYEANFPSIGWVAVQCVNQATNLVVTTTTGAASVRCNITGAQQFRARITGRTVGTVTATAAIMSGGDSGVGAVTIDDTLVDDTAFAIATDRVFPVGYLVDDTGPDTADEGDIGAARMSPSRVMRTTPGNDAGTPVTYGAGAVAATTPRTTLASNDPAVVALEIIDDWDETNRAAVNLIAGQVAIAGGSGVNAANVPRVTLATDDELNDDADAIRVAVEVIDNAVHTRNEGFGESIAIGGELDDAATVAATEGNVSPIRITAQRAAHANLRNNAGTEVGTATDPVRIDPTGTTAQPVTDNGGSLTIDGTVTANQGTANATPWNENIAQINGVTPLMGSGVTGTGSPRVSIATDANTIQISQTTPGATNGVTPVPTSNAAAANALTSSGAAQASNILKASAGNLYSLTITTGATAGYLMIFNATSAPIDGAVTPAYCSQAPANMTSAIEWSIPVRFGTGITVVFSSTGCFTKTESATAAFFAQVN